MQFFFKKICGAIGVCPNYLVWFSICPLFTGSGIGGDGEQYRMALVAIDAVKKIL